MCSATGRYGTYCTFCYCSFYIEMDRNVKFFFLFLVDRWIGQMMSAHAFNGAPLIILHVLMAYLQVFLFCFFGQRLSSNFDDLNDSFYDCEWYRFAVKSRKFLHAILLATQYPVRIRGFGRYSCTHDTYKRVHVASNLQRNKMVQRCFYHIQNHFYFQLAKLTFSYFMTLRQF